jgi:hypothetical protein
MLKLSPQLDADALAAFNLYDKYFESNRHQMPKSVIDLNDNPNWHGGFDSKSPHDSILKSISIDGFNASNCKIQILLLKEQANCSLELTYSNVVEFSLPNFSKFDEETTWRYEQFRYFNPYHTYRIKETNMFIHDIEFVDGNIWSITAEEISVKWNDLTINR